ncbi:protein SPMIP1-like [Symsagittifera roscoffensis]|uniref:protein SPMIP1-like n=1 Tax=Symsagittifera roscoffensis TaxID=84072 RepID=UPI00307BF779
MSGREAGDAMAQNRWKETCTKEIMMRLQWKEQYGSEFKRREEEEDKAAEAALQAKNDSRKKAQLDEEKEKDKTTNKGKLPAEPLLDDSELPLFEMYPVTPAVTARLYDGFSKEGKGRANYLTTRKAKGPERKFPYPVTEAQEVGWKMEERETFGKPQHGRSQTIRTFYRDTGVFYSDGQLLPRNS